MLECLAPKLLGTCTLASILVDPSQVKTNRVKLLEILGEGEERPENPEDHDHGKEDDTSHDHESGCSGGHGLGGTHRCSSIGTYGPDAPSPFNIIDQLVAALHNAGLDANPQHHRK